MLTAKGQAKLRAAFLQALTAVEVGLAREVSDARSRIAARAPSESEEAELISAGVAVGVGLIGTPEGGRFQRLGAQISLREAITTDPVSLETSGATVVAGTGSPARINALTGFMWATRRRGIQGPSLPWNLHYLEAMEDGGTWVVVPRGHWALEPVPGIVAQRMVKTLPPRRMFAGELAASRSPMRARIEASVRAAVRTVGLD